MYFSQGRRNDMVSRYFYLITRLAKSSMPDRAQTKCSALIWIVSITATRKPVVCSADLGFEMSRSLIILLFSLVVGHLRLCCWLLLSWRGSLQWRNLSQGLNSMRENWSVRDFIPSYTLYVAFSSLIFSLPLSDALNLAFLAVRRRTTYWNLSLTNCTNCWTIAP